MTKRKKTKRREQRVLHYGSKILLSYVTNIFCVGISPFLHGLRENGLGFYYDYLKLDVICAVEIVIIILAAVDKTVAQNLQDMFSVTSLISNS